jgi:hypothetical protein
MDANYREALGEHGKTLATHVSLHSAHPATDANELAVTRAAIAWASGAPDGLIEAGDAPYDITVPGGSTVGSIAYWDAATGGTP